jgi:hypothetical protein
MRRRRVIQSLGAAGALAGLSGCLATAAEAAFTYQPSNPVAGEPIVFDASDSTAEAYRWEFEDTTGDEVYRDGEKVTIRTDGPGAFTATLRVATAFVTNSDACAELGSGPGCSVDESVQRVYVQSKASNESNQDRLQVDTEQVNILLKGSETGISVDESASLQFSAANLVGNRDLTIQLIIETPTGVSVTGGAFIESGQGQYTSTFVLDPGESKGLRIQIEPNEPGKHTITGYAVYYFGDDTENRESRSVQIPITVTS